jgi:phospholipase/carboxylesterase
MVHIAHEWLPAQGRPEQLLLLWHGWKGRADAMLPLAGALRDAFPQAALLLPDAPHAADGGHHGRQWYSVEGLTPDTWPQRVDAALQWLGPWVRAQQRRLQVAAPATALAGFSQGAVLALALAARHDGIAGRVLAFGGCLVQPLHAAPAHTTLHLFHGAADRVIPADGSRRAFGQIGALQGDATIDIADDVGHELHPALIDRALFRLRNHIPLRTWRAALGAAAASVGGGGR